MKKTATIIKRMREQVESLEQEVQLLRLCLVDAGNLQSRCAVTRMARILASIGAGGFPNATTIASDLGTSTKTIHRDLQFMRYSLRLPIAFDGKKNGWMVNGATPGLFGKITGTDLRLDLKRLIEQQNQRMK